MTHSELAAVVGMLRVYAEVATLAGFVRGLLGAPDVHSGLGGMTEGGGQAW
jgi:hypothetical protein